MWQFIHRNQDGRLRVEKMHLSQIHTMFPEIGERLFENFNLEEITLRMAGGSVFHFVKDNNIYLDEKKVQDLLGETADLRE